VLRETIALSYIAVTGGQFGLYPDRQHEIKVLVETTGVKE
jgi:hypothetical protein